MFVNSRNHKRCSSILTIGRWSWKLKPVKDCVTTHQSNWRALKMNVAETNIYSGSRRTSEIKLDWKINCRIMIFHVELVCWNWLKVLIEWLYMDLPIVQILIVVAIIMVFMKLIEWVCVCASIHALSLATSLESIKLKWIKVSFKDLFEKS